MFDALPKFAFFTGKGGVGKTSLACAAALALADAGKRVLLVSTDPASNVGQVFRTVIGNRIVAIPGAPGLEALELDPEQAAAEYRERVLGPLRGTLTAEAMRSATEQLSGACTTEIAAFDEFTNLLTDPEVGARYDHVIFDTAPTGHTIRLLQLPGAWSGFLDQGRGDTSCLGPLAGLDRHRDRYRAAVRCLSDPARTRLVLVARAQRSALTEAARTARELAAIGIGNQELALNGLMPQDGDDPLARAIRRREQEALAGMPAELAALPQRQFPLQPVNLVGLDALRHFARGDAPVPRTGARPAGTDLPALVTLVDELEAAGKGLVMLMGKGGVGKTTMAAAIAVELAGRGHEVHLTTTDPAAHLSETLSAELPRLTVSRIDPAVETRRYREHVMATRGAGLDAAGRALLEEDLRSPCTDEIAVFQAFSRIIRESARQFVVMDTAPTGHTLLLLDATGAYHRDIVRHAPKTGGRVTTPMMRLQDPAQTRILIVTLAEPTPVMEAAQLQHELQRAGIAPWAWIINASLAAAGSQDRLLLHRAQAEQAQIDAVRLRHATRVAVVPMLPDDPIGPGRLRALLGPVPPSAAPRPRRAGLIR